MSFGRNLEKLILYKENKLSHKDRSGTLNFYFKRSLGIRVTNLENRYIIKITNYYYNRYIINLLTRTGNHDYCYRIRIYKYKYFIKNILKMFICNPVVSGKILPRSMEIFGNLEK